MELNRWSGEGEGGGQAPTGQIGGIDDHLEGFWGQVYKYSDTNPLLTGHRGLFVGGWVCLLLICGHFGKNGALAKET